MLRQRRHGAARVAHAGRVADRAVGRRVAVQVRVDAGKHGRLLAGLGGVGAGEVKAAEHRPHEFVRAVAEPGQFVDARRHEAVTPIERRVGALGRKFWKSSTRRGLKHGREDFGRRVVNQVAPRVGRSQLEPVG